MYSNAAKFGKLKILDIHLAFVFATEIEQSLYLLNSKISSHQPSYFYTAWYMSDLVGNHEYRFSRDVKRRFVADVSNLFLLNQILPPNNVVYATSENSYQHGYPPCLMRGYAVYLFLNQQMEE